MRATATRSWKTLKGPTKLKASYHHELPGLSCKLFTSGQNTAMSNSTAGLSGRNSLIVSIDVSSIPSKLSGVGRYAVNLVDHLSAMDDLSLVLVARKGDGARWSSYAKPLQAADVLPEISTSEVDPVSRQAGTLRVTDAAPKTRVGRLAWEQIRLPTLLGHLDVEVHHGIHYTLPEHFSKPKVVTVHDMTFFDYPEWHERSKVILFRRAIKVAARTAAALICPSQATADRLGELFAPVAPVFVAPHGVDTAVFTPDEPYLGHDEAVLSSLGIREPYVAFVGTLEPRKDVPSLVRAFDLVSSNNPHLSLVIAGIAGWGAHAVEEAIAKARHSTRIIRLGHVAEEAVAVLLRRAEVVVYPSIAEGFGLPALEALACGAVVVTTSGTAMTEVVGDAALLIKPGDVDGLAEAMEAVISGAEPRKLLRERGIARAAKYTWARSAKIHSEAYRVAATSRR